MEAVYGAYPFVGISDEGTVVSEDPEGYLIFFDMSEFRNKMGKLLKNMDFKMGDKIVIKVKERQSPRPRKKLAALPRAESKE